MSRRNQRSNRGFERTDRLGSLLREIIAEELQRIDDDATAYVTVTDVDVDNELTKARVYLSSLDLDDADVDGVRKHASRIRRAIAQRGGLRHAPFLEFMVDPALQAGTRVESILRDMADSEDRAFTAESPSASDAVTGSDEEE